MMLCLVAAALRQLEGRAAREVRHEAVEQDVLAVGGAAHGAAQRGRAGRVQRERRAVHERRARQHHRVRAAPLATVPPRTLNKASINNLDSRKPIFFATYRIATKACTVANTSGQL